MADNVVQEFSLNVNLAGAAPVDVMFQDPPGGAYEVAITGVRQVTKEGGKTSLRFSVGIVEEGVAKGIQSQVVIGTDWSKAFNVGHLMNCLMGLHTPDGQYVSADKLKGQLPLSPGLFQGKRAFMLVKPAPAGEVDEQGRQAFADKNFLTREMYESAKKLGTVATAAPKTGGNSTVSTTAPAPTAAPAAAPTALKDIFG